MNTLLGILDTACCICWAGMAISYYKSGKKKLYITSALCSMIWGMCAILNLLQ